MHDPDWFLEITQTTALITTMLAQVYAVRLFRQEISRAAEMLREVLRKQIELEKNIGRNSERMDSLEARHGIAGDVNAITKIKRITSAVEAILREEKI